MNNTPFKFHPETPQELRDLLTPLNQSRRRVRIFFGDRATGTAWLEEHDVTGTIGKSFGGDSPIPLLINNARSMGGPGLLDHCIVKMMDIASGRTLYQHPKFNNPADRAEVRLTPSGDVAHVFIDNELHATFTGTAPRTGEIGKAEKSARRWIEFMQGKRFSK